MINGMNWDYFPIGTTVSYSLWNQPDDIIRAALDEEMSLLKNMGVNTVRMYTGVQAKWITYIYEKYGIYTMLNHSFGRYGLTIDGGWMANTEYSDPRVDAYLMKEAQDLARSYNNTPGLLMYLLGNENNYGLSWRRGNGRHPFGRPQNIHPGPGHVQADEQSDQSDEIHRPVAPRGHM